MHSALIPARRSYPALGEAPQLAHQRSSHLGPLVLEMTPLTLPAPTTDRDRTVSRRSEPSSRAALMGEQPNPWDLLQPQDATSRHRGAKPPLHSYRVVSIHPEGTFGRLRYALGGDRPSQTTRLALSAPQLMATHETQHRGKVVFHCRLHTPHKGCFTDSHLSYVATASSQGQGVVKLHGVFLSCRG